MYTTLFSDWMTFRVPFSIRNSVGAAAIRDVFTWNLRVSVSSDQREHDSTLHTLSVKWDNNKTVSFSDSWKCILLSLSAFPKYLVTVAYCHTSWVIANYKSSWSGLKASNKHVLQAGRPTMTCQVSTDGFSVSTLWDRRWWRWWRWADSVARISRWLRLHIGN